MISAVFAVAIFLYITVIFLKPGPEQPRSQGPLSYSLSPGSKREDPGNEVGPGVGKCRLDDLSELGFTSEQFSSPSSRIWEKCARNIRSETELIRFFRGKSTHN